MTNFRLDSRFGVMAQHGYVQKYGLSTVPGYALWDIDVPVGTLLAVRDPPPPLPLPNQHNLLDLSFGPPANRTKKKKNGKCNNNV